MSLFLVRYALSSTDFNSLEVRTLFVELKFSYLSINFVKEATYDIWIDMK
jgi:hypothetical protein